MTATVVDLSRHAARRRRQATLVPWTVDHFRAYCGRLVFEDGKTRDPEPFQLDVAAEVFKALDLKIPGFEVWNLIPEGNGKTTFVAELALYGCDWAPSPWIPVVAHSLDQAGTLYEQAKQFVENTPGLLRRFKCLDGARKQIRPLNPRTGKYRPGKGIVIRPWDPDSNDGAIPFPFYIGDELHRHPTMETWRLLKGKCKKRKAIGVGISTAGYPGEEFEQARDAMRQGAVSSTRRHGGTIYRGRRYTMVEFRLDDPEKALDPAAVARVNPLSLLTEGDFAEELASPNFDIGEWKRLKCNIAARSAEAAISDEEWARAISRDLRPAGDEEAEPEAFMDIPDGERRDVGLDLGWKHDTTALVEQWYCEPLDFHLWNEAIVIEPPRDGSSLHPDHLKRALYGVRERGPIDALVMDMTDGEDIAAWAKDELGVTVVDRPQGNNLAVLDYKNVMRGLRTGKLRRVPFCPMLTRHSMNAVAWRLPKGDVKFERPNQSRAKGKQDERVIDALVAGGMVYTHACGPDDGFDLSSYRIQKL